MNAEIRYRVDPRVVSPTKAARYLGLTLDSFSKRLPALLKRGFPAPTPCTENFDLKAIDIWLDRQNPDLLIDLSPGTAVPVAKNARDVLRAKQGKQCVQAHGN